MKDYNCSIYISKEKLNAAIDYLQIRDVDFISRPLPDGTIEISAEEKFGYILDRLSMRCHRGLL